MTRLVSLKLAHVKIRDTDCVGIAALTRLTELDLNATAVSDIGVQELSRLVRLQRLDLTWTAATAPPALSSLTELHMDNCQVSPKLAQHKVSTTPLFGRRVCKDPPSCKHTSEFYSVQAATILCLLYRSVGSWCCAFCAAFIFHSCARCRCPCANLMRPARSCSRHSAAILPPHSTPLCFAAPPSSTVQALSLLLERSASLISAVRL